LLPASRPPKITDLSSPSLEKPMLLKMLKHMFGGATTQGLGLAGSKSNTATLPTRSVPSIDHLSSFFSPAFWDVDEPQKFAETVKDLTKQLPHGYHASDNFITWSRNN
jgi:hypothetical protein